MGRQQSLFTFQGKKIDTSEIKIKAKALPGPPLADGEIIELAISGTARSFHYERRDGRLVVTATVEVDASKLLSPGTFDELEDFKDASFAGRAREDVIARINNEIVASASVGG